LSLATPSEIALEKKLQGQNQNCQCECEKTNQVRALAPFKFDFVSIPLFRILLRNFFVHGFVIFIVVIVIIYLIC
jgi:hypothetical protein